MADQTNGGNEDTDGSSTASLTPMTNLPSGALDHKAALSFRDRILEEFRGEDAGGPFSDFMTMKRETLFIMEQNKAPTTKSSEAEKWDQAWQFRTPFTIGAGLVSLPRSGTNTARYQVVLRVQARGRFQSAIKKQMSELCRVYYNGLVSIGWTSPASLMASNPDGRFAPWKGPKAGRAEVGSPINIGGGAVGAVTLVLAKKPDYFALSAGHVVYDDNPVDVIGRTVYTLPQPLANADQNSKMGLVSEAERFPLLDLGVPADDSGAEVLHHDYAIVSLSPAFLPFDGNQRRVGTRAHSSSLYRFDPNLGTDGLKVVKAAAKTREALGRIVSTDVSIEGYDRVAGRPFRADGLIEVELDHGYHVAPGDSGALLCIEDGRDLHPAAILLAAVRVLNKNVTAKSAMALYALPLRSVPKVASMGVL